jgi:hypothetical protein
MRLRFAALLMTPMCYPGAQDAEDRRSEGVEIASFWLWDVDGAAV